MLTVVRREDGRWTVTFRQWLLPSGSNLYWNLEKGQRHRLVGDVLVVEGKLGAPHCRRERYGAGLAVHELKQLESACHGGRVEKSNGREEGKSTRQKRRGKERKEKRRMPLSFCNHRASNKRLKNGGVRRKRPCPPAPPLPPVGAVGWYEWMKSARAIAAWKGEVVPLVCAE